MLSSGRHILTRHIFKNGRKRFPSSESFRSLAQASTNQREIESLLEKADSTQKDLLTEGKTIYLNIFTNIFN